MKIVKRDGRLCDFDSEKIKNAVLKAFVAVDGELTDYAIKKADNIAAHIKSLHTKEKLTVDQIQDLVENGLMSTKRKDVARAYMTYRNERDKVRERCSHTVKVIEKRMGAKNVENSNANVDEHSFGGQMGAINEDILKEYALYHCMSDKSRYLHINNIVYIHDLGSYAVGMHNCLSIPFDDLLAKGFNTKQTDVRPANSVNTAFQLVAVIFQLQSLQQFGGVSATHLDWTMVPYVRKSFTKHLGDGLIYLEGKSEYKVKRFHKWLENDPAHPDGLIHMDDEEFKQLHPAAWEYAMDMTEKETMQAVEGMYHNLNY